MQRIIRLIIVFMVFNRVAYTQPIHDWHLEKDHDGIRVFSRHLTGSRLKELRVLCTFQGTLATLVAMLSDIENYPKIFYKTKTSRLLRRMSDADIYYYIETELPWPVDNRDMNVHLTFVQELKTHILRIQADKAADEVPPRPHVVQVADWLATWEIRPQANQQLQIDYHCQVDPGGKLPVWLINLTAASGPYEYFKRLRNCMLDARYQGHTFGFLTE